MQETERAPVRQVVRASWSFRTSRVTAWRFALIRSMSGRSADDEPRREDMSSRYSTRARGAIAAAACLAGVVPGRAAATPPEQRSSPTQEPTKMTTFQKPSDEELRERLTPEQYRVTQQEGTEPPFRNAYADNHQAGIYVDVVSGEPLFSSLDKFDSGTGWPSFTRPLDPAAITDEEGPLPVPRPHRGALEARRLAPWPRLRRRSPAHRPALLHQLRRPALRGGRAARRGGVRSVSRAAPDRLAGRQGAPVKLRSAVG